MSVMKTPDMSDDERRQKVALFRYGVITDLIHLPPGHRGMYALLAEKAKRDYDIPDSLRRRVEAETIRGWLREYRKGGFDALLPKVRNDKGQARAIPPAVADVLVETKEQKPGLSVTQIIDEVARMHGYELLAGLVLAPATVHRLLSRHGLMDKAAGEPTSKDRRRFSYEKAGELWMSDVMHGPAVFVDGRKRKAYLIAFLDDATRIIPYAAFALSENTAAFLPVLEQAIRRRGIPKRLYVDNGAAYRSAHLALVCAKLGITLIHARPYAPQGKGKMERWFRTTRMRLLPLLGADDLKSLEALNRRLWVWVESEYHNAPHRGLDEQTPADRWAMCSDEVRMPDTGIGDHFLFEQKRRVAKDRTVSLDGILYEVDATLVGETVLLRYDPSRRGRPVIVCYRGKTVQLAKPVDPHANCFVRRQRPASTFQTAKQPDPPPGLRLRDFDASGSTEPTEGGQ